MYDIKKFEPLWGSWYIKKLIGEGGYGKAYRIEREEYGIIYKSALKHIKVPQSQSEVKIIMMDGMDEKSATAYFEDFISNLVKEFALMSRLKGNSHIVSYEDHKVIKDKEKLQWDIFIRMELLTSLIDYISKNEIGRKDIIKLGIDICKALEVCQKYNIIHRDIKPENIFVYDVGDFKLGDFGIARQIDKTMAGLSKKGTYTYIAPEIYKGEAYGSTVDIYSLGLVMYRLLNNNRMPFIPPYPQPVTYNDREISLVKRISGKELPKPVNADGRLAEIVLKACAYNPKDRYENPTLMRKALEAILYSKEEADIIYSDGDSIKEYSLKYVNVSNDKGNELDISDNETAIMAFDNDDISDDETVTMALDNGDKSKKRTTKDIDSDNIKENKTRAEVINSNNTGVQYTENSLFNKMKEQELAEEQFTEQQNNYNRVSSKIALVATGTFLLIFIMLFITMIVYLLSGKSDESVNNTDYVLNNEKDEMYSLSNKIDTNLRTFDVSGKYIVAIKPDRTIITTSEDRIYNNRFDEKEGIDQWADIISVGLGNYFTVGLKNDGTVVAAGNNTSGQCNVESWNNIVSIAVGFDHTVGLKSDGTVIVTGDNSDGQCNVENWNDITAIAAGSYSTIGLTKDGTVMIAGSVYDNSSGEDIKITPGKYWEKSVVKIYAGGRNIVGLKTNGDFISNNYNITAIIENWTNIRDICFYGYTVVGLKNNGDVMSDGKISAKLLSKNKILEIASDDNLNIVGLKDDGSLVDLVDNSEIIDCNLVCARDLASQQVELSVETTTENISSKTFEGTIDNPNRNYFVNKGDTPRNICIGVYGEYTPELWEKIKKANGKGDTDWVVGERVIVP
ncbi:MAG: protein kinase [Lachnospirales bacterium]